MLAVAAFGAYARFPGMRVCIAASGLGHVARGIEAWAADLGAALAGRKIDVTLCKGGGTAAAEYEHVLPCWQRGSARTQRLLGRLPRHFLWRLGLASGYGIEQTTFACRLIKHLRRNKIDILHVQDPQVAALVQRARRLGVVRTRTILAHGTEEPLEFQRRITYLQHLAPWHLEEARAAGVWKPSWTAIPNFVDTEKFRTGSREQGAWSGEVGGQRTEDRGQRSEAGGQRPEGVGWAECNESHQQRPEVSGQRAAVRAELGIPEDALVVLTAAAIKRDHKRVDYVIREFARMHRSCPPTSDLRPLTSDLRPLTSDLRPLTSDLRPLTSDLRPLTSDLRPLTSDLRPLTSDLRPLTSDLRPPTSDLRPLTSAFLVVAGGWEQQTDALVAEGKRLLGDRVRFLVRFPRERMPDLYRAADLFVLAA